MKPLVALLVFLASTPSMAQSTAPAMAMPPGPAATPADQAYMQAMQKMQAAMQTKPTGNADRDFVAGMIPHHQGAIDMARVELQYGKDPAMRRLANNVVVAQQREIAEMRAWQAKHGGP